MSNSIPRRVGACIVIGIQLFLFLYFGYRKFDVIQPLLQFLTWCTQTHLWTLTLSSQSFQNVTHTLPTSSTTPQILAFISALITFCVNGIALAIALSFALPVIFLLVGLLSGIFIGIKNLAQLLIAAHRPEHKPAGHTGHTSDLLPAQKMYAFDRGWRIEKLTTENLHVSFSHVRGWWLGTSEILTDWAWMHNWFIAYWLWLLKSGFWLAYLVQYVVEIEISSIFTCLAMLLLVLWILCILFCIALFSITRIFHVRLHHIFLRCPACHKDIAMPIQLCPHCQTQQTQLRPGTYGIFSRRCITCRTKLPTLNTHALKKLPRICPHCTAPLDHSIGEGTNIHIALIGSTSAGKTTYLMETLHKFTSIYAQQHSYHITFTNHLQKERTLLQYIKDGSMPPTTTLIPHAYTLKIQRTHTTHIPHIVYLYDTDGKAFSSDLTTSQQEYLRYIHGIIFMIDPLTLPFSPYPAPDDVAHLPLQPGNIEVMQMYERMLLMLEATQGVQKNAYYPQSIAIVVTKIDMHNLTNEIGITAAQKLMDRDPTLHSLADAIHQLVRTFLSQQGLDHFIRDVEAHFKQVEYFSCSTIDSLQTLQPTRPLPPVHLLRPLTWILTNTRSLNTERF